MIGRRRQGERSNSGEAVKAEARVVSSVQRSLGIARRIAELREHPVGAGTPLTEPVLVFYGKWRQELRVFDQDPNQLGVARWSRDKTAKLDGYGIYSTDDEVPLAVINWRTPGWLRRTGDYSVSDSEGIEIATVSAPSTYTSALAIMVGAEKIGYLKPRPAGSKKLYHPVEDDEGREVARITYIMSRHWCVADIEPSLAGPLRTVAVAASIIDMARAANSSSGGGAV